MATSTSSPPTVAIIGCGPGGMFFCHALETYIRELTTAGDDANLAGLPIVTCFERSSDPGGVWRAKRSFASTEGEEKKVNDGNISTQTEIFATTTNMYEALWTNGPKEGIEFFDYTFDEHFGGPLPVYMPRQALLEYMISRVTKHCLNFFEKYVQFNTSVVSVKYIENKGKFEIDTRNTVTGETVTGDYDKCIWAAGQNGKPQMPASVISMFREGGFQGRIIHSSDTADFETDVKGKRILLIGGGYSAEDLALMAVKVGAEKVYISSRCEENVISWTSAWPMGKVKVLYEQTPVKVRDNGRIIQFTETQWVFPDNYVTDDEIETEIRDIDTVIFCTGYSPNMDMLDFELRAPFHKSIERKLVVPADWKMTKNEMSSTLGDVKPGDVRWFNSVVKHPDIYRGILISNPSMIFMENEDFGNPLFGMDVHAWLLMRFVTGTREVPSQEEMMRQNEEEIMRQMQVPYIRYYVDEKYNHAYNAKYHDEFTKEWYRSEKEYYMYYYRVLARAIQEADYPVSYGTYDELNETAKTIYRYGVLSYKHRASLQPKNKKENKWRTFRDYKDSHRFRSIFTGTEAVPLKSKWLDIDANDQGIQNKGTTP